MLLESLGLEGLEEEQLFGPMPAEEENKKKDTGNMP